MPGAQTKQGKEKADRTASNAESKLSEEQTPQLRLKGAERKRRACQSEETEEGDKKRKIRPSERRLNACGRKFRKS